MKKVILGLAVLGLLAGMGDAQSYHDYRAQQFVLGGYATTSTLYWNGLWMADAKAQTLKHLTPKDMFYYNYNGVTMDVDNKKVIWAAYGTTSSSYSTWHRSGIYRIDPGAMTVQTVMMDTMALYGPRGIIVNQDGDYVFGCYQQSPSNYAYLKLTSTGSTLSTILDSTTHGWNTYATTYGLGIDIDTGLYLFNLYKSNTFYYSVIQYDDRNNAYTTFGGGNVSSMYGWYGYYSPIEQNMATGDIQGYYYRNLYELKKGGASRTTLWQLGLPGGYTMQYCGKFDLQSAPMKRFAATGYNYHPVGQPNTFYWYSAVMFNVDASPPYVVTATDCDPNYQSGIQRTGYYARGMDFYRGRHVQTFKTAPRKWDVRVSCPRFPLKQYVMVCSLTGVRPGITLPDGRTINLAPDFYTNMSLLGLLKPFFDAGPQILDKDGEAQGKIDLTLFPNTGVRMWIAVAIIDAAAPSGIAYLPDTDVFWMP
jgi:hypothetical protein